MCSMYVCEKLAYIAPTEPQILLYAWHSANWNCYVDH